MLELVLTKHCVPFMPLLGLAVALGCGLGPGVVGPGVVGLNESRKEVLVLFGGGAGGLCDVRLLYEAASSRLRPRFSDFACPPH